MSRDQRVRDNHALLAAQNDALEHKLPLIVIFNVLPRTGHRAYEHYEFMLQGLRHIRNDLKRLNIPFMMTYGNAVDNFVAAAKILLPQTLYFDFNPLSGVRSMQHSVANQLTCLVHVVDTHNIVPAWVVSNKREYAAHTIRRKIHYHLQLYLVEPDEMQPHPYKLANLPPSLTFESIQQKISALPRCGIRHTFKSGESAAQTQLATFIADELESYASMRNDISDDHQSQLSPYLHYGQLSSLRVALEAMYAVNEQPLLFEHAKMAQAGSIPSKIDGMNALYEEMIVRKELSDNYCLFTDSPTSLTSAEPWAQQTLQEHQDDPRELLYTRLELEQAKTHDKVWNAAQRQMTQSGKMHGYMRMYWAKKILEWSATPQDAIDTAVYLNDHYSLDGGDPNGYVGIMWSMAGIHDRPWRDRPIFGKIRYMNEAGLRRKFDVDTYSSKWQ
ncbi:MAG: deoxyribodipyrimidine photo-lyase [Candidatus Saccharimonadales bacterium]